MLRELVTNLVDNALRYTPTAAVSPARSSPGPPWSFWEIEDSGVGISEDEAELVFERFYRVNDAGTEGSGLGLAIVREIALQHDASATLRPNPAGPGRWPGRLPGLVPRWTRHRRPTISPNSTASPRPSAPKCAERVAGQNGDRV